MNDGGVGPGMGAFTVFFILAIVLWLLMRNMNARLRRMVAFIERHFASRLTLADIAADASISKSEALRCFKSGVQTTPIGYLNRYRLNYARARLLSTAAPITRIAVDAGFSSTAYFDRVFRRCFGLSPAAYRRQRERQSG